MTNAGAGRSVSLRGLTLNEAKEKIRELIDTTTDEYLADYEIYLVDYGATDDEIAAGLARARAENVRWREEAIERLGAMVARGGKSLN